MSELSNLEQPQIGQKIYIPPSIYVDHGRDDIEGGLATIDSVRKTAGGDYMVGVTELRPRQIEYGYKGLMSQQEALREQYGESIARPDPDMSPESNPPNYGWSD